MLRELITELFDEELKLVYLFYTAYSVLFTQ